MHDIQFVLLDCLSLSLSPASVWIFSSVVGERCHMVNVSSMNETNLSTFNLIFSIVIRNNINKNKLFCTTVSNTNVFRLTLAGSEQWKQFCVSSLPFCLCDTRQLPSQSGNASRTRVSVLMLPLPTCSQCALQRKASHRHCARTSMIYEPSVASDVPVA